MPGFLAEYEMLKRSVVDLKMALLMALSWANVVSMRPTEAEAPLPLTVRSIVGFVTYVLVS